MANSSVEFYCNLLFVLGYFCDIVMCVGRSTDILVGIVIFDIYCSSRKSLRILISNNKQRNDMQKSVYFASMTYRLRTHSLPFSGISTYGNVLQ